MKASEWLKTIPENHGHERDEAILAAVRAGSYVLDWDRIKLGPVTVEVSSDVLRIGEPGDSVRVAVSCRLQQQLADMLDCMLPTDKISHGVWEQAANRLRVYTQPSGPKMSGTAAFVEHNRQLDDELGGRGGLSTAGKDWVLCQQLSWHHDKAANYGWHRLDGSPVQQVINLASVHAHGLRHTDYAQFMRAVDKRAWIDRDQYLLPDLLKHRDYHGYLVSGGPLTLARHPGVPMAVEEPQEAPGDTLRPWRDPSKTLGQRCVAFSRAELDAGVCESPPGSNDSGRIRTYLSICVRDGKPVGVYRVRWCAAGASFALRSSLLDGEQAPHEPRVSGYEMWRDAMAKAIWRPTSMVRSGEWEPSEGDIVLYDMSTPGVDETHWRRHVVRYIERTGPNKWLGIGANEADMWVEGERSFDHPQLLGFVEYPRKVDRLDAAMVARAWEVGRAVMQGEPSLEEILASLPTAAHLV